MASIEIDSGIKTQDFTRKSDGKKLSLSVKTGDVKSLMAWMAKAKEIEDAGKIFSEEKAVEGVEALAKDIITMILGAGEWKRIYKFCDRNIFAVMKIVTALSKLMKDGIEENVKK